jgi:hypothetical protein
VVVEDEEDREATQAIKKISRTVNKCRVLLQKETRNYKLGHAAYERVDIVLKLASHFIVGEEGHDE